MVLHKEIYTSLRTRLVARQLPPRSRIPTERELCAEFQASRITVAKALARLVQEGYLERKVGSGTFVTDWERQTDPSPIAKSLCEQIAILITFVYAVAESRMLHGITDTLRENLQDRFLISDGSRSIEGERDWLTQIVPLVESGTLRGLIANPTAATENRAHYEHLARLGCQIVFLDRYYPRFPVARVSSDNSNAVTDVMHRLHSLGHRRIAYLYSQLTPNSVLMDRRLGYERGLMELALDTEDSTLRQQATRIVQQGRDAMVMPLDDCEAILRNWFAQTNPPTAIFCANDCALQSALLTLRRMGVRVGSDVTLAGFIDKQEWLAHVEEPFLGICQRHEELGRQAAISLRRLLQKKESVGETATTVSVDVDLWFHPSAELWHRSAAVAPP